MIYDRASQGVFINAPPVDHTLGSFPFYIYLILLATIALKIVKPLE
jgi:hypothetical protein